MKNFTNQAAGPAFSLVEVAIAMAILAVGMTGVLALLPVGLDSARQVHNETIAANVARSVIGNLWLSNQNRTSFLSDTNIQYFDQDGRTPQNNKFRYFQLSISSSVSTTPGSGTVPQSCRYLLTLEWPVTAVSQSNRAVLAQKRVFVTEVVKEP